MKKIFFAFSSVLVNMFSFGRTYIISSGDVNACSGNIYDSGVAQLFVTLTPLKTLIHFLSYERIYSFV